MGLLPIDQKAYIFLSPVEGHGRVMVLWVPLEKWVSRLLTHKHIQMALILRRDPCCLKCLILPTTQGHPGLGLLMEQSLKTVFWVAGINNLSVGLCC